MTPDAFEEAGYELLMCYGSRHCSVLPHAHARLWDGAEYCAIGEVIFLDKSFVTTTANTLAHRQALELLCSTIAECFLQCHHDWPLREIIILK